MELFVNSIGKIERKILIVKINPVFAPIFQIPRHCASIPFSKVGWTIFNFISIQYISRETLLKILSLLLFFSVFIINKQSTRIYEWMKWVLQIIFPYAFIALATLCFIIF